MVKVPAFNAMRLKVSLKLAINRLRLLQSKKTAIAKQQRKELSELLRIGKEESARVRVELIIRDELDIELMELLELYCELLLARFGLIEGLRECDPGIFEAVCTVIYAAPRSEARELTTVSELLMSKYGREFSLIAMENKDNCVNERVVKKLKVHTPSKELVDKYLLEVARSYDVNWFPEGDEEAVELEKADVDALDLTQLKEDGPDRPLKAQVNIPDNNAAGKPETPRNGPILQDTNSKPFDSTSSNIKAPTEASRPPVTPAISKASVQTPAADLHSKQSPAPTAKKGDDWESLMARFEALKKD